MPSGKCSICGYEATLIKGRDSQGQACYVLPEHGHGGDPCDGELKEPKDETQSTDDS
jgi:hypothetical protein